jgi:hypothetical protein
LWLVISIGNHFLREIKMSRRIMLGITVLALVTAGMLFAAQLKTTNRPPGVESSNWIPLTYNSGILLSKDKTIYPGRMKVLHGILVVKVANEWKRIYMDAVPGRFMPLQSGSVSILPLSGN